MMEKIILEKTKKLKKLKLKEDALRHLSEAMSKNFYSMSFKKSLKIYEKVYKKLREANSKLWVEVSKQVPAEYMNKSLALTEDYGSGEFYLKLKEEENNHN